MNELLNPPTTWPEKIKGIAIGEMVLPGIALLLILTLKAHFNLFAISLFLGTLVRLGWMWWRKMPFMYFGNLRAISYWLRYKYVALWVMTVVTATIIQGHYQTPSYLDAALRRGVRMETAINGLGHMIAGKLQRPNDVYMKWGIEDLLQIFYKENQQEDALYIKSVFIPPIQLKSVDQCLALARYSMYSAAGILEGYIEQPTSIDRENFYGHLKNAKSKISECNETTKQLIKANPEAIRVLNEKQKVVGQ